MMAFLRGNMISPSVTTSPLTSPTLYWIRNLSFQHRAFSPTTSMHQWNHILKKGVEYKIESHFLVSPRLRNIKWGVRSLCSHHHHSPRHFQRGFSSHVPKSTSTSNSNTAFLYYTGAVFMVMLGASYAAVPLYRMFCQASGLAGTVQAPGSRQFSASQMTPVGDHRPLRITFNSDVNSSMAWSFRPVTRELKVLPGETALAFYTATNPTDSDIVGISTYNVTPYKAAVYFNKIQCFCFEEQILRAGETVDLPVFFFIDPEFCDDPLMQDVDVITLSYTFFNVKTLPAKVTASITNLDSSNVMAPMPAAT